MGNVFAKLLARSSEEVILMDGGMGTTTEDRGVNTRTPLWGFFSLLTEEGRKINDGIHSEFIAAGAEILIANTHNTFLTACEEFVTRKDTQEFDLTVDLEQGDTGGKSKALHEYVNRSAVESAQGAVPAGKAVAVATCIGSVEDPYAVESKVPSGEAARMLETEIAVRQAAGSDLILFETLTTREEIKGAAQAAARKVDSHYAVGLTCGEDGRTLAGVRLDEAVKLFSGVKNKIFFIQCTRYDRVERAMQALRNALDPDDVIGVYANDGRHWDSDKMLWNGERITPEVYGEYAMKWRTAGARIIGGCCGTGPEHITHLKKLFS